MKKSGVLVSFILIGISCSNHNDEHGVLNDNISDSEVLQDDAEQSAVVISAESEPMDGSFYFPDDDRLEFNETTKEIHIVPVVNSDYGGDSSDVFHEFFGIFSNDFFLYPKAFQSFNGHIKVWYDAKRSKLVAEFGYKNQRPDGRVKVYDVEGILVIDRIYDQGKCIETNKDLFAIDWTFIPQSADLEINNFDAYESINKDNHRSIHLGPSMHESSGRFKNDLSKLIEKPVFENLFKVNGEPYTGELTGYFLPYSPSLENSEYFIMNFLDGKLHGDVQIYDWMMGLTLHEVFSNGELSETVYVMDPSEMDGVAKPVIYLYPQKAMNVNVSIDFKGKITHSYPKYFSTGWNVVAKANGLLFDQNGKEYYALFWEGQNENEFTYKNGFVVRGEETMEFLENALEVLGLNRREANEFIMYWLPQMENNAYNLIHFSTDEYEQMAELKVNPKPETVIRVMMVWSPLKTPVEIPQQNLYDLKRERQGFTVVEWGGKKQQYQYPL